MDNRRPTNNSPRPLDQTNNYRNDGDRRFEAKRFEPRDNRYPPRDNRYPPRDNDRFQNRDERPRSGDTRFQNRNDRYQNRDDRPQNRDDRFQSRDDRGQSRDNRFQPREGGAGGGGRFQPRNDRYQPRDSRDSRDSRDNRDSRDSRFQPRGRFAPKGKGFKPWEREPPPVRIVSDMQVTDGKHRGKYLQSSASEKVRPTARRIREVMFRILYRRIRAGRFLDLCAGAGTVGIEAISRGALIATFVERSAKMGSFIKKNMATCGIKEGHGEVCEIEVVPFLKKMSKRRRQWDVVYFDPPYDSNYDEVLDYFSRGTAIRPGGVLVVEHHVEMFFPENFGQMKRWRVLTQGDTSLSFYERR